MKWRALTPELDKYPLTWLKNVTTRLVNKMYRMSRMMTYNTCHPVIRNHIRIIYIIRYYTQKRSDLSIFRTQKTINRACCSTIVQCYRISVQNMCSLISQYSQPTLFGVTACDPNRLVRTTYEASELCLAVLGGGPNRKHQTPSRLGLSAEAST